MMYSWVLYIFIISARLISGLDEIDQTTAVIETNAKDVTCNDCKNNEDIVEPNETVEDNLESNHEEQDQFDDFALIKESDVGPTQRPRGGRSMSLVSIVFPEILVVVDHALFLKLDSSESKTKDYVTLFMSAVNQRYKDMTSPRIELKIAEIQIGKSASDTPYLASNIVNGGSFEAQGALEDLGRYFFKKEFSNFVYDIVLVLTAQEMCTYKGKFCNPSTAGYAYVGGACVVNSRLNRINSVGIVEDCGGYSGVIVAAHEIAHLLGAQHDGQPAPDYIGGPGASSCSWKDGYIMSDDRRTNKGHTWSTCSRSQMTHYLNTQSGSCLYNSPKQEKYPLQELSGLVSRASTADEQCMKEKGTRSCFSDSRICAQLFCVDSKTGSCLSYRPALEGTACDGNGFCSDGICKKFKNLRPFVTVNKLWMEPRMENKIAPTEPHVEKLIVPSEPRVEKLTVPTSSVFINSIKDTESVCKDQDGAAGHGLSCQQLYRSFAFAYCTNMKLKEKCCSSYIKYC